MQVPVTDISYFFAVIILRMSRPRLQNGLMFKELR